MDSASIVKRMLPLVEDQGLKPHHAAKQVIEEIIAAGQAAECLRLVGPHGCLNFWSNASKSDRQNFFSSPSDAAQGKRQLDPNEYMPLDPDLEYEVETPTIFGPRKVNLTLLKTEKALLEVLYEGAGQWRRLGDFQKKDCRHQGNRYQARITADETRLSFFRLLEQSLPNEDKTIRDVLTEAQVRRLATGVTFEVKDNADESDEQTA